MLHWSPYSFAPPVLLFVAEHENLPLKILNCRCNSKVNSPEHMDDLDVGRGVKNSPRCVIDNVYKTLSLLHHVIE